MTPSREFATSTPSIGDTGRVAPRVALARKDHRHGGAVVEPRVAGFVGEPAGGARVQQRADPVRHPRQQHLGLGIAEAAVELEHLRPVVGEHHPGEEHTAIRSQLVDDRRDHGVEDLGGGLRRQRRHRRVGAHPAGVRPGVAVADPLVVLRRVEQHAVALAVGHREHADLGTGEQLLDHDRPPCLAERALQDRRLDRRDRGIAFVGHRHALAGGEPVGLHHGADPRARRGTRPPSGRRRTRRTGRWERRDAPSRPSRTPSIPRSAPRRPTARTRCGPAAGAHRPSPRRAAPRGRSP